MKSRPDPVPLSRSAAGTAFGRARFLTSLGVLGFSVLSGLYLHFAFKRNNFEKKTLEFIGENDELEEERKMLMGLVPRRSAGYLRGYLENLNDPSLPGR